MNNNTIAILLVEDNEDIRDVVERALKRSGYNVFTAENGLAALNTLRAGFKPGVIITDLEMPIMCGREFVRKLKNDEGLNLIPTILFSSHPDAEVIAKELGVNICLPKFAGTSVIEDAIFNLLKLF